MADEKDGAGESRRQQTSARNDGLQNRIARVGERRSGDSTSTTAAADLERAFVADRDLALLQGHYGIGKRLHVASSGAPVEVATIVLGARILRLVLGQGVEIAALLERVDHGLGFVGHRIPPATEDRPQSACRAVAGYLAAGMNDHIGKPRMESIVRRLKEAGFGRARLEGAPVCDWVLIDAEDVIVHLFRPEVRKFYNLERIWSETARAPLRPDA